MRTDLDEQDAARILAERLGDMAITGDELLAYLAYLAHQDPQPLTREAHAAADIEKVGVGARHLREKVRAEL